MNIYLQSDWKKIMKNELTSTSFLDLSDFIDKERSTKNIFPSEKNIFNALNPIPFEKVKVIILGQDPYHNAGQAHGLSFSVPKNFPLPPSLKNIYREIESDLGIKKDFTQGNLTSWSKQGVLLLNSILSVEENNPGSHKSKGWEEFTDAIIRKISDKKQHCVFILWGSYAKAKSKLINNKKTPRAELDPSITTLCLSWFFWK